MVVMYSNTDAKDYLFVMSTSNTAVVHLFLVRLIYHLVFGNVTSSLFIVMTP